MEYEFLKQFGEALAKQMDFDMQYLGDSDFKEYVDKQVRRRVREMKPCWMPLRVWRWLIR